MKKPSLSIADQKARIMRRLTTHDGGLNRYEAEAELQVCQLAPRIFELKESGCVFAYKDEAATDPHGIVHKGIRRYWLSKAPAHMVPAANDDDGGRHE